MTNPYFMGITFLLNYEGNKRRMILSFFNVTQVKCFPLKNEKVKFENNGRINSRLSTVAVRKWAKKFKTIKAHLMQSRFLVRQLLREENAGKLRTIIFAG
jgi:hypothetical protein